MKSCSVPYTQGGTASAATYTCSGAETSLVNGPAVEQQRAEQPGLLNPGGTDNLVFTISLPTSAENTFQGKSAALNLTFTGIQRTGSAR